MKLFENQKKQKKFKNNRDIKVFFIMNYFFIRNFRILKNYLIF